MNRAIDMRPRQRALAVLVATLGGTSAVGCNEETFDGPEGYVESPLSTERRSGEIGEELQESLAEARAELTSDQEDLEGEAQLFVLPRGVRVAVEVSGVEPGAHGLHIHEKGDCSDIQNDSMGGHYDPGGNRHALPAERVAGHLGDLGNMEINEEGRGRLEFTVRNANLEPGAERSLLDRSIVLHAEEDAGSAEQPAGGSGTPVACGVIEAAD